ncbi:unnamed protein product [Rhodiola kirilowii]
MQTVQQRNGQAGSAFAQQSLPCPRCESLNTKFCYYNNYNHSQPRHFCKACRRYWTHGGTLRNIPVGGFSRKTSKPTKRSRHTTTATSPTRVSGQLVDRKTQKERQEEEEEERVWSGVNIDMNQTNFSFSSLLNDQTDCLSGYGFGLGLMPGYDEFGFGAVGDESVSVSSGLGQCGSD